MVPPAEAAAFLIGANYGTSHWCMGQQAHNENASLVQAHSYATLLQLILLVVVALQTTDT